MVLKELDLLDPFSRITSAYSNSVSERQGTL